MAKQYTPFKVPSKVPAIAKHLEISKVYVYKLLSGEKKNPELLRRIHGFLEKDAKGKRRTA